MNFLIQLIVGVVLSLASTLLQQAFAPKPKSAGSRSTVEIGGKVPQYFLMGTVAEAGKREYRNTAGSSGETPNAYLVEVLSFGDLPVTAMTKLFVNGVEEPVSSTGHVTQGYPTTGDKAGKLWIEFRDGTETTASSFLLTRFGGDADRPWLSDMIGRGVPQVIWTAKWSEKIWAKLPEMLCEFQGIKLYDPRKDTTAGGSGAQRWDTPATWAFSDNNAVMIYNILRGIFYAGGRLWGGSCTAAQLPYDVWAAAMDACDASVALLSGGTEKAFRAGRRVNLNERPSDVITELLIGCNGRISHAADGQVYILVGVPDEADGAFTDDDVLATEALGSIPFPNLDGIINGATATYREPSQAWEDKETAPYLRSDLVLEDDGREQTQGLDLSTTFSGTQAQRILKAVIEEGRRFRTHVVALPPEFAHYRPLHVLAWSGSRFDYDAKLFLITARTRDPWGNVVCGLQEIDPADHAWDAEDDEQPLSFSPVVINRPAPQPMTGWYVAPYVHVDDEANARRPGIEVGFAAGLVDVRAVRVQIRRDGEADPFFDAEFPYDPAIAAPALYIVNNAILPNQPYEARGIYLAFSGRETEWSAWLDVTTPNVKLTAADIEIELDDLAEEIAEQIKWIGTSVRDVLTKLEITGRLVAEQDIANFGTFNQLRRGINVKLDGLSASFDEVIEVALGPGGAIATALSALYAAMGGNSSEVNVRWQAVAAPSGYSARYAIQAAVNDGTFRAATFMLDVPSDPDSPTRVVLVGDQVVLANEDASVLKAALLVEDGEVKFVGARAGRISSPDGVSYIDFGPTPEIHLEST